MRTFLLLVPALALTMLPSITSAQPTAWCDDGASLAVADGALGAGEYPGSAMGLGAGFGGMLGENVEMHVDSDAAGNLAIAIDATGETCAWGTNDTVVVYLDSIPGSGFNDTTGFTDAGDPGRIAISGVDGGGSRADLTFAPDFFADYAIAIGRDSASLFELRAGAPHVFVGSLGREPVATFGDACVKELDGISLSMLGSQAGNPIRWFATLLNPFGGGPFRSNEFQGVASPPGANIGVAAYSLASGDRNTLASFGAATGVSGPFLWVEHATFDGSGFTPTPTCGQLSSERWAVSGLSDGDLAFSDTGTTGDYARGTGTGTSATGGVYAFTVAPNDVALGVTPGGSDFTPGAFTMAVRNDGASALTGVGLELRILALNSQDRSNSVTFEWSEDGVSFTPVPALDFASTELAASTPVWEGFDRSTVIGGLGVAPGGTLYLRWVSDDLTGSGSRDRLAIDDIVVTPVFAACGDGTMEPGEACDAGGANGATACGCQTDCTFGAVGTGCGSGAGGACDAADTCDGSGTCVDRFDSGTVCRAATGGPCDVAEVCDGSGPSCPADGFASAGIVCATADPALPCDVDDVCDGTSAACPSAVASAGTSCRASTGTCDLGATCDGSGSSCPASTPAAAGIVCRAATEPCDVDEACDGSALGCPADTFAGSGTVCRPSADDCDVAETCTGTGAACPSNGFASASTVCRASAGDCDVAETCTGVGAACPSDAFASAATVCRTATTVCDVAESCTGSAAACPTDGFASGSTICRAATGDCDLAETCTGASDICPADALASAGTVCRVATGGCDVEEVCGGVSAACPTDAFASAGTSCRASAGDCDVAESCDGASATCPSDAFEPAGTVCRAATGTCDAAESCTGSLASCPTDASAPDGTACADGTACNGDEVCASGTCAAGTAVDCDDGDVCTADMCAEPSGACAHTAVVGCCTIDAGCDDGDACTADTCNGSNTCDHTDICVDAGMPDGGALDGGALDAGALDDGGADGGALDGGALDGGALDGGVDGGEDAGATDGGTSPLDAAPPIEDAGADDASIDATVDGGEPDPMDAGCSCRAAGTSGGGPSPVWLLGLGLLLGLRRRRR